MKHESDYANLQYLFGTVPFLSSVWKRLEYARINLDYKDTLIEQRSKSVIIYYQQSAYRYTYDRNRVTGHWCHVVDPIMANGALPHKENFLYTHLMKIVNDERHIFIFIGWLNWMCADSNENHN